VSEETDMSQAIENASGTTHATLVDTTRCVGCRSCQVSCKQWNELDAERTALDAKKAGLQQPTTLSARTFAVVTFSEVEDAKAPGGLRYVMAKRQCMHCAEPSCASACPVTAMHKTAEGPVVYDEEKCIGCRYCMWACPFGVPTAEWDSLAPRISKCTMCHERCSDGSCSPAERNGVALSADDQRALAARYAQPACVKACPSDALVYGEREELLRLARARMEASPGKYVDHVYGEEEAGGTNMLYLSAVPFERLGFPSVGTESYPRRSAVALGAVPPAVIGVGAALGGAYAVMKRREAAVADEAAAARRAAADAKAEADAKAARHEAGHQHPHHVEFERLDRKLWTPANLFLAALMAFGAVSFVARFALGLGGSTNLSDTYAWGLWIVFDLVWIAVAAGAFATAGLIYVFQRKDLYGMGRSAVLMGLLSYSFVTVTLLADLGLPWHFYELALNAPEHSAMFEVSWCVGLYVTVLAFEFFPVPFERWGLERALDAWKRWSPVYVVLAVTLFVWLMSRNLVYAAGACAVFGLLAFAFRPRPGQKPVPVMLAIAAVTLSTMHQSSLGSLFLLMPDKLDPKWWSPLLPVEFFVSSIAAGTALMVLVEMAIAYGWRRSLRAPQLAAMGKVAFWALLAYLALRLGGLAARGATGDAHLVRFAVEVGGCGLSALALLSTDRLRRQPRLLAGGAFLAVLGVVLNRVNVVVGAMTLKGPAPQMAPAAYTPSVVEWGVSIGLVAATVFLFGLGARTMPVLPKDEAAPAPERRAA
jgi:formate dehydrogenase iron-sulfur subunit